MRTLSARARRAIRALAWQTLGFGIIFALLAIGIYRVETTVERVTTIERVQPIDLLRECLRTPKCRELFRHPERLRTHHAEGGDASQPAPIAGEQPGPQNGGGRGTAKPPKSGRGHKPSKHAPTPAPSPFTPPALPVAPPQPGNSGDTPAATNGLGVRACVDLAVSACVRADTSRLLP